MADVPTTSPDAPATGPKVGVDEWVARSDERTERYQGLTGAARRQLDRVPELGVFAIFVAVCALIPVMTSDDYIVRVATITLIYALLSLGLNVAVGFAGLLDLGYVAFYGFGAYAFATLSSDKFGIHWPTWGSLLVIFVASLGLGFLLALPSRRLVGDYLAIVTLFFGQIFYTVVNQGYQIPGFGLHKPFDLTGGPSGIVNVDPFRFFGHRLTSYQSNFYVALIGVAVVFVALHLANSSRTGRAWRALRDDPLAAEVMSMPVGRLKLLAIAVGACVAAFAGTLTASSLGTYGAFPADYTTEVLITIYAMLILGGAGSLQGAVLGAIVINVMFEVLRTPDHARWIFYLIILLALLAKVRPWRRLAVVLAGTAAFGFAVHAIVGALWERGTQGLIYVSTTEFTGSGVAGALRHWLILPANTYEVERYTLSNYLFVLLIALVLTLTVLKGWAQTLLLIPTLYLGAIVWETRLVGAPETRIMLLGAILVVLMAARPQGILGTPRVEIV